MQQNVIPNILDLLDRDKEKEVLKKSLWVLSNLCRGYPQLPVGVIKPILDLLSVHVSNEDEEVLVDVCWALSHISGSGNEYLTALMQSGVCAQVLSKLVHPAKEVHTPALRVVGNFTVSDDSMTQYVLDLGALSSILPLLQSPKSNILKEACWTVSNVTAGERMDDFFIPSLNREKKCRHKQPDTGGNRLRRHPFVCGLCQEPVLSDKERGCLGDWEYDQQRRSSANQVHCQPCQKSHFNFFGFTLFF